MARFTTNKGQWPAQVAYRALVPDGALFVEQRAFTFTFHSGGPMARHADADPGPPPTERAHAYRVTFEGASDALPEGDLKQPHYENFFLGNDPARWGTGCAVFGQVRMTGLYPGIDLEVDGRRGLKYGFLVAPGADPSQIRMHYTGQEDLALQNGRLVVRHSVGNVVEERPVAWQETTSGRRAVACSFRLEGDRVGFDLPDGWDLALPLVIDPDLIFSTYTGSAADNFGFTATYDNDGHAYGGGIVFDQGYPTSTGALDPTFNGGTIDIGVSKFSPDGSQLIWSTYIGGSANEAPHSLVVNSSNELYVLGTTSSSNYPVTSGAYDTGFNGGTPITPSGTGGWAQLGSGYGFGHPNGTDIVVSRLSADATSMLASTFVGGSGNDGLNNVAALAYNYGDHVRGEIALDAQEWPVVCTSTQSSDIPVSPNAPQTTYGGDQDAYIFRMDPALGSLQATFHGGSGPDSGYGVQFSSDGRVYTTGGTSSTDLPTAGTPLHASNQGGVDGWVARWSTDLSTLQATTYLGTAQYDQAYFVQLDTEDQVYLVGQTHGNYPVSPDVYANPGSSQFIHKLDPGLATSTWSTVIGSGYGEEDIAPSAFLVSDCGQIYFSGWGGLVNQIAQASSSTTNQLPLTPDAFQSTTDGSDFYLMVLDVDASGLNYATYFGGSNNREHVDGGTSRFDKHGTVYQAVCAGCPGTSDFPVTPNAYSTTNGSFNCNLGVFKFDLIKPTAHIEVDGPTYACLPDAEVGFINLSTGGTLFDWDFGDGTTSNAFEPTHVYGEPGVYTVQLVLSAEDACLPKDTAYLEITISEPQSASIDPVAAICPGDTVQLHAHGGMEFTWLPSPGITDLQAASPFVHPPGTTTYTVIATDSCGTDTASVTVEVLEPADAFAGTDTTVCQGNSVQLAAFGGAEYAWSPADGLDDPTAATPLATPTGPTTFHVVITTPEGCPVEDSLWVDVVNGPPIPVTSDTVICRGDQVQLQVSGGQSYTWLPAPGISELQGPDPVVAPDASTTYTVLVGNACDTVAATVFVDVHVVHAMAWPDTLVCPNDTITLLASGGENYLWSPTGTTGESLLLAPAQAGIYTVEVDDGSGCTDTASAVVELYPPATVIAGHETTIDLGESAPLFAMGNGTLQWWPDSTLSCSDCPNPLAAPMATTTYTVELTDANGCKATDQVTIHFTGHVFVPNTFTPNGDGINDRFQVLGHDITHFRLTIFNRWGEEIFTTNSIADSWNGAYNGQDSPIGTYVWRIDYRPFNGTEHTLYGHVNLVR